MKQIYIFGDSILKGVTYSEEAGRHKLLPGRFSTLADMGYQVKNCSIMGATVAEGCTMLQRKLTDPASDTTVLLEEGGEYSFGLSRSLKHVRINLVNHTARYFRFD